MISVKLLFYYPLIFFLQSYKFIIILKWTCKNDVYNVYKHINNFQI